MKREHTIDTIFALMLFCVFTASVLFVLISGANCYKNISKNMQAAFEDRTCVSYVSAKIHGYDSGEKGVDVKNIDGVEVLVLSEKIEETTYNTYIYCTDGYVKELYCESTFAFDPLSGFDIMPATELSFSKNADGLIEVVCVAQDGKKSSVLLSLRSGKAVA